MLKFFIVLICSATFAFADSREDAVKLLSKFSTESSLEKRLQLFSKVFLGLPYGKNGPLGEGPDGRYDQDPLYRFDTFDCTTYVETIMALALSKDVNEFEKHLDLIRYEDGVIDYLRRNHFTDLQWIPFNSRNGYMREITEEVTSDFIVAEAVINFPAWLKNHKLEQIVVPGASKDEREALLQELRGEAARFEIKVATVPYIQISKILSTPSILNKIPSGTIVNFVRPNWNLTEVSGTHQNISHQGFLFRIKNALYLRHASTEGKVENVLFKDYLKRFRNSSSLKGIHLMTLNQPL